MVHELEVPLSLAGLQIECDESFPKEIGARMMTAVVIARRELDRQEDKRKTGSLYAVDDVLTPPAKDDEWFTQEVIVKGKNIVIKVNGKELINYTLVVLVFVVIMMVIVSLLDLAFGTGASWVFGGTGAGDR